MPKNPPIIEVDKERKTVTITAMTTFLGHEIKAMVPDDNDSITFDFTTTLDLQDLAKLISEHAGSPDKPGWTARIAEAVATEGLKTVIKEVVVRVGKSLFE